MATQGKKHLETLRQVEKSKTYDPKEAIEMAKKLAYAKFDESVEVHLRMGVDPRHADQQVRGVVSLPHGLGKKIRVLVFAQGEGAKLAQDAGADYIGGDDLAAKIDGGWLEFDVAIATPDMMSKVGKLGKILGRRGLMPNPKTGTVVAAVDLPRVIRESRGGRVEFKLDRTGIIHLIIGKVSFETDKLLQNLAVIMEAIVRAKPSGAKGQYVRSVTLTTTMGPGIKLDLKTALTMSTGS